MEVRMAGKVLSLEPTIDPTAKLHDTRVGAYCEVGARTILHEVTLDDYSYVVNDAQVTYATIGKFCSIAAMTRINPGNHPMHRLRNRISPTAQVRISRARATTPASSNGDADTASISATTSGLGTAPSCCQAATSVPAR
jgi:carbonic anhydrase/acetyltransferase-like protein (isoleucine patch superfamily)